MMTTETSANTKSSPNVNDFRNLLTEPVFLKCPSCGTEGFTRVEENLKRWADIINRLTFCLFHCFCCCLCLNYQFPFMQTQYNHYCKHCNTLLGRAD